MALCITPVSLLAQGNDDHPNFWPGTEGWEPPNELDILGIGGHKVDPETGIGTFYGLIGTGVGYDRRYDKTAIEDVTVSVYENIGTTAVEAYENETPLAVVKTGPTFLFNENSSVEFQKYRNLKFQIDGFVGERRRLVFITSKEGFISQSIDGYLFPVINYSVEFESNGGTKVDEISGLLLNSTIHEPEAPHKEGHKFLGWYKDNNLNEKWNFNNDLVTNNMTLYAKWEKIRYSNVTLNYFDDEGETVAPSSTLHGMVGDEFELLIKDIDGYSLDKIKNVTHLENKDNIFIEEDMIINIIYTKNLNNDKPEEKEEDSEIKESPNDEEKDSQNVQRPKSEEDKKSVKESVEKRENSRNTPKTSIKNRNSIFAMISLSMAMIVLRRLYKKK